jgi:hypothetical protein
MVEGLFLYRVDAKTTRTPIGGQHYLTINGLTNKACATLAFSEGAKTRANRASDSSIVLQMPKLCTVIGVN